MPELLEPVVPTPHIEAPQYGGVVREGSVHWHPFTLPPKPLEDVEETEEVEVGLGHWHAPNAVPCALQVWRPAVPPRQAQLCCVPATQA